MNPDRLLNHFATISEADDAVPRLRQFILDLAVRGKLAEQNSNDEPASELLKRIQAERARLVKIGSVKEPKSLPPLKDTEIPYSVPSGWKWTRLGDSLNNHLGGGTPSKTNAKYWGGNVLWASVKDIGKSKYVDQTIDRITPEGLKNSSSNLIPEGNLIVVTRMGLGKASINHAPMAINQDLRALFLSSLVSIDYCYIFFKTVSYEGSGLTVKGIKVEQLLNFPFPMPPLAEQHRIVAKVDELMALCDELEEARTRRETHRDHLVAATLHRLNNGNAIPRAGNDTDFKQTARFYLNHLPRLATRPDHIKQLRQTILTQAVKGRLVSHNSNDDPVDATFPKLETVVPDDLESDGLPQHWAICTFRSLTSLVTSGSRGWKQFYAQTGAIFIRTQNIKTDRLLLDDVSYVRLPKSTEGVRAQVLKGDILITITGANVTKAARVESEIPEAYVSQHIALACPRWFQLSEWLHLCLISPGSARGKLEQLAYGAKPGLNLNNIRDLRIPVPPLAEQHRIVAKVNELMTLCDELEAQLTTTATTRLQLLEATLHEALSSRQVEHKFKESECSNSAPRIELHS